ncbi:MAG: GntR family transcriptional regulator [Gemmatimonadetes bacterium]|nr:GntR family transcriptional regulator [Gemmatimonadota bacterium]
MRRDGRPKSVTAAAATTNVTPATAAAGAIVTLGESAYQQLKQMLMQGAFTPGEAITVRAVSEALGIGATPVREALQRLAAEGVLEGSANMGVRTARLERAELETLYETRMLLEGEAAVSPRGASPPRSWSTSRRRFVGSSRPPTGATPPPAWQPT